MSRRIFYHYGVMGSGKSTEIQRTIYQYESKGFSVLTLKPSFDNRDGENVIYSRQTRQKVPCMAIEDFITKDYIDSFNRVKSYHIILVDEVQFCTPEQIYMLDRLAKEGNMRIVTYGLYKDFKDDYFPATKILDEIAGEKTIVKGVCECCGGGATHNVRLDQYGKIVIEGEQNVLGGTETGLPTYITLCDDDFRERNIGEPLKQKFKAYWESQKFNNVENINILHKRIEEAVNTYAHLETPKAKRELRQYLFNTLKDKTMDDVLTIEISRLSLEYLSPKHKDLKKNEIEAINELIEEYTTRFNNFTYTMQPGVTYCEGQKGVTFYCKINSSNPKNQNIFYLYGIIDRDGKPNLINDTGLRINETYIYEPRVRYQIEKLREEISKKYDINTYIKNQKENNYEI